MWPASDRFGNLARGSSHTRFDALLCRYAAESSVRRTSSSMGRSEKRRGRHRAISLKASGGTNTGTLPDSSVLRKASELEMLNHLEEAFDSGYLTDAERRALEHATKKAIKAANGLIRYLESTPDP
jgi:hypothetical protein